MSVPCSIYIHKGTESGYNTNIYYMKELSKVMNERILTNEHIQIFTDYLRTEEKRAATCEKYLRDIRRFMRDMGSVPVTKELLATWKRMLIERGYAVRSVNSMLASVNSILVMLGWGDCRVKNIRFQRQLYCAEDQELTKAEYLRLLEASGEDVRLNLILQTICGTGIRVSELRFFTVEAIRTGWITVECKSKIRTILLPGDLRKLLLRYAREEKRTSGAVFVNGKGKPVDRSTIWRWMKQLCQRAGISPSKVFPHNLRKLFARTFYGIEKDIAKLADILGHSSIDTTRIYIMTTGREHRRQLEQLGLVFPEQQKIAT